MANTKAPQTNKRRNNLRRAVSEIRTEVRKLMEEVRQEKWEEFPAGLEHNPDPAHERPVRFSFFNGL